ncbi:MAG: T9SS type A sorting domain-containing protein [Psychroflexus salarius]
MKYPSIVLILLFLGISLNTTAQVTEIWTDYQGYWRSSNTNFNSVKPDNTHNLLAFRFNGTVYSTNVNNAILDDNNVTYTSVDFRALPVSSLPTSGGTSYFVGFGASFDNIPNGVDNSATFPFNAITNGSQSASLLTRGEKGLDLGSGLTNIPQGTTARFNLSSGGITVANLADGVPDILVSQIAQPSGSNTDNLYFVDVNDNIVGNAVNINLSDNTNFPAVGAWNPDFYNLNSTQNQTNFINTERDFRFFATDLSNFGITAANAGDAVALIYEPRGTSDSAFLAFNEPSLGVASQINITAQPTESLCNGSLDGDFTIQVEDFNGNAVPQDGIAITAFMESGAGELLGTTTQLTNAVGVATFDDLAFEIGGVHKVRFEYSSLAEATSTDITSVDCSPTLVWTGDVNSDWDNPGNWSTGVIPNANYDVEIPTGRPNYPILNVNAGAKNLTLGDGASIILNGKLFGVAANIIAGNNVNIAGCAPGSELYFFGTANQRMEQGVYDCAIANLTIENPSNVNVGSNIDITETLNLIEGTLVVESTSTFTFKSTASQTAVLSEVDPSASISGCVVVERYIPASNRAFRYIAASVNTTVTCGKESIQANLQEGNQISNYNNYTGVSETPGFGTHITGSSVGANGFDATITGNPSMFSWNQTTQQWGSVPNTDTKTLNVGEPYSVLVRGGRELDLTVNNTQSGSATTLRFTGELETGDVPVNNLAQNNGQFSLVANPYQAQVDMRALLTSVNNRGLSNTFIYVYDPTLSTRGGYATVDLSTVNGTPTPIGSAANKYLQPNQAIFIENTGNSPTLSFKETFKRKTNQSLTNATFSLNEITPKSEISIELFKTTNTTNRLLVDGMRLMFADHFSNSIQEDDAEKFWNSDESFAIEKNSSNYLAVERRAFPDENETTSLFLWNSQSTEYQVEINVQNFDIPVFLKDNYTDQLVNLTNNETTSYSFNIDESIPESASETRLELVFEPVPLNTTNFNDADVIVYPNPVTELINIDIPQIAGQKLTLELVDMAGRLIYKETLTAQTNTISTKAVQNLKTGVYNVNIQFNNKNFNKKIIVK